MHAKRSHVAIDQSVMTEWGEGWDVTGQQRVRLCIWTMRCIPETLQCCRICWLKLNKKLLGPTWRDTKAMMFRQQKWLQQQKSDPSYFIGKRKQTSSDTYCLNLQVHPWNQSNRLTATVCLFEWSQLHRRFLQCQSALLSLVNMNWIRRRAPPRWKSWVA